MKSLLVTTLLCAVAASARLSVKESPFAGAGSYPKCIGSASRCMPRKAVGCSTDPTAPLDRTCCVGACVPMMKPKTPQQPEANFTFCDPKLPTPPPSNAQRRVAPEPPVLPKVWVASKGVAHNLTTGAYTPSKFWFSDNVDGYPASRSDFDVCPFLELWQTPGGYGANLVPCSIIFYNNSNYYVYPSQNLTCEFGFPAWNTDQLCVANATYGGSEKHLIDPTNSSSELVEVDKWEVQWYSDYSNKYPLLNYRNTYTLKGTNTPFRMRDNLIQGWQDMGPDAYFGDDYSKVPRELFTSLIDATVVHKGYGDHLGHHVINKDKTCVKYPASTLGQAYPSLGDYDGPAYTFAPTPMPAPKK